jgi:OmpA-OmpF porin, OOP family
VLRTKPFGPPGWRAFFSRLAASRRGRCSRLVPAVALWCVVAVSVHAEPIFLPVPTGGDRLEITEKENLRRRVGGTYTGYVYREFRGILAFESRDDDGDRYSGTFYLLEDLSKLGATARFLEDRVQSSIVVSRFGVASGDPDAPAPRTQGFPVLPADRVEVGSTWREYGTRIVEPGLDGKLTRVRFYCEYRYDGVVDYLGEEVYSIRAQYALRYRAGDDPDGDRELTSVSGSHIAQIAVATDGSGRTFIRTEVNESYRYRNGREITQEGFLLTWLGEGILFDRDETVRSVEETLEREGIDDVRVERRDEGVAITLEKIHFVPDSPQILPSEVDRLDLLYDALSPLPGLTFLVVGHTADVGTAESQLLLSVERAQTVIAALVERGIPADRFIYTGKGGTEPVAENETEAGRARNRRVEVIILDR